MKLFLLITIILTSSCAYNPPTVVKYNDVPPPITEMKWEPNKNFWLGKHEEKLALHPIFATMPVESRRTSSGVETRRYVQGGSIKSADECKGNHCAGDANVNACNHVFYIQKSKITNYHRVGSCANYVEDLNLRPLNDDGDFEASNSERELLKVVAKEKSDRNLARVEEPKKDGPRECTTRADCLEGMTCKISEAGQKGLCVNHGIFGQIFNQ